MRPLVMRCGAFGDMVLLTPLLRLLRQRFGEPADVVSWGAWTRPLLHDQPDVREIFILDSRRRPYWTSRGQQRLVAWLRRRGAGPTWYCDGGPGRGLLRRGGIADDQVCEANSVPWLAGEHYIERWIRFARLTPPAYAGRVPCNGARVGNAAVLEIAAASRAALDDWLARRALAGRPLIVIQAGNKRTMRRLFRRRHTNTKYWPEERWGQVLRAVRAARPGHAILLLGVPQELALNEDIRRSAAVPGLHNVADDLPIGILLPLLQRARSMISVDTGPAHAAAALGCPTVVLFGQADPVRLRPGGVDTPAAVLTGDVAGCPDILGISAEAVIRAWQELAGNR